MNVEEMVGIRGYITGGRGIDGRVKERVEDFYVEEVADVRIDGDGNFTIIRVKKVNWDTLNFVRRLADVLRISQKRIHYAGTKDKRGVTVQYFAISNLKDDQIERLKGLRIKDAEVEVLGRSRKDIRLGDLIGNKFRVVIRGAEDGDVVESIFKELCEKGTPNFFGLQRFGSIRFITHEVGLLILKRDYESAFWTYVAKPFEGEREDVRRIREELWETRDAKMGLRELPSYLRYERLLLQKLREGKSEREALLSLPENLKTMFVHAYQSYVFNRVLSARIEEFGSLKFVEKGDWVDFVEENRFYSFSEDYVRVGDHNISRVRFLIDKRIAALSIPLPGYETELGDDWTSERIRKFLEEDGVSLEDFRHEYREFSSKGGFRPADIIIERTGFKWKRLEDGISFEFFLPKGCYATVLLREFVKRPLA